MKKLVLPFLVVLFFVSESIVVDLWPKNEFYEKYIFVPRFLLITIVFITVYVTRFYGIVYGFVFGLLYDVFYTEILGVYMFIFALIAYLTSKAMRVFYNNVLVTSFLSIVAVSMVEFYVYGIYLLIGKTDMPFEIFLYNRLLPTIFLNTIFVILVSYPLTQQLIKLPIREREDEDYLL
ncbi:MAG TPA: rod shape-determining protein MreD [Anoxybacillus sp.]|nr:rod shape-determining protein MreD [Anoxybacillus sp.]